MRTECQAHVHSDIVVCGGGPAGIMAAVSAARMGCDVSIIEHFGFFGGAATACLVVPISGFFKNEERVVGGLPWEFISELIRLNAARPEMPKGHISVDPEYYKLAAQRMILKKRITPLMNSTLISAQTENGRIASVEIVNKSGMRKVIGKVFIDATGDGDLCALAGVPMKAADTPQPLSLCFELTNVDVSTPLLRDSIRHNGFHGAPSCNMVIRRFLEEKYQAGESPLFGGPWFNTLMNGDRIAVNMTRNAASVLDASAYSQAEFQMREDMFTLVQMLRDRYPEFAHCVISSSAVSAGVREGRHLVGRYQLTGDDVLNAVPFSDSVARCAHIIDIHQSGQTTQAIEMPAQAGYIPYRSMITDSSDNLIGAGRLISADPRAHASIRVQGTCMATGQAAGIAAALALEANLGVQAIDVQKLRVKLKKFGGIC